MLLRAAAQLFYAVDVIALQAKRQGVASYLKHSLEPITAQIPI